MARSLSRSMLFLLGSSGSRCTHHYDRSILEDYLRFGNLRILLLL
jgi:hypothetical protein